MSLLWGSTGLTPRAQRTEPSGTRAEDNSNPGLAGLAGVCDC